QDRGDDREQQQSDQQHEHRDFVTVDAARGAEDKLIQRERRLIAGPRRLRPNGTNSYRKSAEPRTRRAPAPPDRVRHAPSPLLAATAIASGSIAGEPANRSTLLSSGFAPKESRS